MLVRNEATCEHEKISVIYTPKYLEQAPFMIWPKPPFMIWPKNGQFALLAYTSTRFRTSSGISRSF